ncbi:hypothetical protein C8R46DRAFT_1061379 [Mycena filopes]|nr:hypothetical protein C8R46DRAFT_1061379 [Mycena filopes]
MATTEALGQLCSKRIQFHIDAATALPTGSKKAKTPPAYVSIKITDIKDQRLRTSAVKGQIWNENLSPTRISDTSQVVFEVKHRSVWPLLKPSAASPLAVTDAYPLSTLLKMQGGNTFDTNIELPLHAQTGTGAGAGSLSVNIRELTSIETVKLCWKMAGELERKASRDAVVAPPEIMVSPPDSESSKVASTSRLGTS